MTVTKNTYVDGKAARPHHMPIKWEKLSQDKSLPAKQAPLKDKTALVTRMGLMMLKGGTESWHVTNVMDRMARVLNVTCIVDLGLLSIDCTCIENDGTTYTSVASLASPGVDTYLIWRTENLMQDIEASEAANDYLTVGQIYREMDKIEKSGKRYSDAQVGFAAAFACAAFIFLLGGGLYEMAGAFVGAGFGNYTRRKLGNHHINQFTTLGLSVAIACLLYFVVLYIVPFFVPDAFQHHEGGYIGAMLFVIPGFPLITSGLDIAKMDIRSSIERLTYTISVIFIATLVGWLVASTIQMQPDEFTSDVMPWYTLLILRMVMTFVGVFCFSVMFNGTPKMCIAAGCVGAIANTLRLSLGDYAAASPEVATLTGALVAGLLASIICKRTGFTRISLTVPSTVIMVPGLFLYRAMYYLCIFDVAQSSTWGIHALLTIVFIPIGLALARIIIDKDWRYCS